MCNRASPARHQLLRSRIVQDPPPTLTLYNLLTNPKQTLTQSGIGGKSQLVTWRDTPDIDWVSHWAHHLLFGKLTPDFFYNSARNAVKILSSFIFAKLSTSNEPPSREKCTKKKHQWRGCEIPCKRIYINCVLSLTC